jgi:anaerobic magnesium-protoporphyrin IX monomethyl ester cyclase
MNRKQKKIERRIDCLLIGHNETDFTEYEESVRKIGINSPAYRDLNLNFIWYDGRPLHAAQVYNLFSNNLFSDNSFTGSAAPMPAGGTGGGNNLISEPFNAAVAYLGTFLNRRGFTFDYVHTFREEKEILAEKLTSQHILTVAVITTLYVAIYPILEIVEFIRRYNRNVRIIVGGPFMATQCRIYEPGELQYMLEGIGADIYVNSSQGETALVNIIKALKTGTPLNRVNNIYYRNGDRKGEGYIATQVEREDNRLTENPVDWRLFTDRMGTAANLRTAISCPFRCSFCGFPEHAGKYQLMDADVLEEELDGLDRIRSVRNVQFIDDTFNVPLKRFKEILRRMIKNKYRFKWHSHFRCQYADRESVELMKESGCEGVFLGIESGSDRILKNMNKNVSVNDYYRGIRLLEEYGLITYGSFIIGFPGETENTVGETVDFIKNSGLRYYRSQLWYCDPITPICKEKEKYRLTGLHFDWSHVTMTAGQACNLIDRMFLTLNEPQWVPQYNFEFDAIFQLLQLGKEPEQVKTYIKSFNNGVREKFTASFKQEISPGVVYQIKTALLGTEPNPVEIGTTATQLNEDDAAFDL